MRGERAGQPKPGKVIPTLEYGSRISGKLLMNDAASDAIARIAGRVGFHVVGFCVDH